MNDNIIWLSIGIIGAITFPFLWWLNKEWN